MKQLALTLCIVLISHVAFSQTGCSKYYSFAEGTHSQITTYDKKGQISAVVDYTVVGVVNSGGSETATMNAMVKDEKGELIAKSSYDIVCSSDMVSIDFKSLVSPKILEQFGQMDYDITGTNIDLPNNLTVGQSLPDADMNMKINMSGITMNMNIEMINRKVVGEEVITTLAGKFNCMVITYDYSMKMGINQSGTAKQWIAEGVGMVKQEDYSKKGKVMSSSELTAFSK
jgi:hypothetical protein